MEVKLLQSKDTITQFKCKNVKQREETKQKQLEIMKDKKTLLEKELTTKTKQISTLQESLKQMKAKLEEQRRASLHELLRKDDKTANLTQCIETQKH